MVESLDKAVSDYVEQTMFASVWPSMREAPAYKIIEAAGEDAIPALLRNLAKPDGGGMCVMQALAIAAKEWPAYAEVTEDVAPGWKGFHVSDAREAWLKWGREKGHIE